MLKRFSVNLLVMLTTLVVVIGGVELGIRKFYGHRIRTYFEDQTVKALGDPVPAKGPDEYRIFIFGGSAAYGFPLADRYSVTAWLRKSMPYLLPHRKVKVINTAWPGKGSHYVLEGALNVLKYDPDLFVIYSGYNEVPIANRLYLDNGLYWLNLRLKFRSYAYRWLSSRINRARKHLVYGSSGHVEKHYRDEVVANRVYKSINMPEHYYQRILNRYRQNMETLIRHAKQRGIDVLFLTLPANVRNIPPTRSVHSRSLTPEQDTQWKQFFEQGLSLAKEGKHPEALRAFEQAATWDEGYAELQYRLGLSYEQTGDFAKAKKAYNLARDFDAMPWRARSSLNTLIREIAEGHGLLFLDIALIFELNSTHGIVGNELIYDNVHPSEYAQRLIADEVASFLSRNGKIAPPSEWQWEALRAAREGPAKEEWSIDTSVESHHIILRGIHLWEQGHYDEMVSHLEKGLLLKPDFLELYGFLGDAYWHLGKKDKALNAFQTFQAKDPGVFKTTLEKYPDIQQSYTQSAQALKI